MKSDGIGDHGLPTEDSIEYKVPLFLITKNKEFLNKYKNLQGPRSAFQIFPTILEEFGYDRDDIFKITKTKPLYEVEEKLYSIRGHLFSRTKNEYQMLTIEGSSVKVE